MIDTCKEKTDTRPRNNTQNNLLRVKKCKAYPIYIFVEMTFYFYFFYLLSATFFNMTIIHESPVHTLTMTLINNVVYLLEIITFTKLNKIKIVKN